MVKAYNPDTIFRITLEEERHEDTLIWTDKRTRWGGLLGFSIKTFTSKEGFKWCFLHDCVCGTEYEEIGSDEEFLKKFSNHKIKIGLNGPEAWEKANVTVKFVNGNVHTEYFDSPEEAKSYYYKLCSLVHAFEFGAFRTESQEK